MKNIALMFVLVVLMIAILAGCEKIIPFLTSPEAVKIEEAVAEFVFEEIEDELEEN